MIAVAFVLGYLGAHPGWFVAYVSTSAVVTVGVLYYAIDDGHGHPARPRHKATRRASRAADDAKTIAFFAELQDEEYGQVAESQVRAGTPNATGAGQNRPRVVNRQWWSLSAVDRRVPDKGLPAESDWSRLPPPVPPQAPAAAQSQPPALAPPPVHHDEFRPAQRWHREPVTVTRVPLPPVTGHALAVLAALTAPVRAHLDAAEQAKREAIEAEALAAFPEWKPWPGDDTLTSMRAIKAEVA